MPRAAAAIPLLDASARVRVTTNVDAASQQPRRGPGGPPDGLGSAGGGRGAENGGRKADYLRRRRWFA